MSKEFRLELSVVLPPEAFAEAAALVAIKPVVTAFVEALEKAQIKHHIEHEVVNPRGKQRQQITGPHSLEPKPTRVVA